LRALGDIVFSNQPYSAADAGGAGTSGGRNLRDVDALTVWHGIRDIRFDPAAARSKPMLKRPGAPAPQHLNGEAKTFSGAFERPSPTS
jgi:hypothetical protein